MSKTAGWVIAAALAVSAAALSVLALMGWRDRAVRPPAAEYHAVLLSNGQAFFGRISNLGAEHPFLEDDFFIQSRVDPDTKQVSNVLIKRGREWHAPDYMILNRQTVLFVEPVGRDSQVAKLIAEQKAQRP